MVEQEKKEPKKQAKVEKPPKKTKKAATGVKKIDDPYKILRFVHMTEKSIRMIELQNKIVFIVDNRSKKADIRAAVETAFETPVSEVNTVIDQRGRKKAYIKFEKPDIAGEIAIRLGII